MLPSFMLLSGFALVFTVDPASATFGRGLAWATDNRYAPSIAKEKISWYHHWQDGPVSEMPSKVEYVPMYWGPSKNSLWNSRKKEMAKNKPKYLLTFNEPDISSQANMNPKDAAKIWMDEIHPWAKKGVKVGSPAVAWDFDWLEDFLKELHNRGGYVDFICIHWYGSWKDFGGFKRFVMAAHRRFGKHIWIPELGITSASNPSKDNVKTFMQKAFTWMEEDIGYVDRAAWFGCFLISNPPDNFASGKNGLFASPFTLSDMGHWYKSGSKMSRRSDNILARHVAIRENTFDEDDETADHCDVICQHRNASLSKWESENPESAA